MTRAIFALALVLGAASACDGEAAAAAAEPTWTAERVIARHLAALGGVERLRASRSLVIRGEYQEGNAVDEFVIYRARPARLRKEGTRAGEAFVKLVDGERAWFAAGDRGFARLSGDTAAALRVQAEFDDPLIDAAARGHRVELLGAEVVAGRPAHHLKLTLADGAVEHRWIDADSFLDVRRADVFVDRFGEPRTRVVDFSDWREVDGIWFNFASEGEQDGRKIKVTIAAIEVDGPIDPATFVAPEAGAEALAR